MSEQAIDQSQTEEQEPGYGAVSTMPFLMGSSLGSAVVIALSMFILGPGEEFTGMKMALLFVPLLAVVLAAAFWMQRNVAGGYRFRLNGDYMRSCFGIAIFTALFSSLVFFIWYKFLYPEVMELRFEAVAAQLAEDGWSEGDVAERMERYRKTILGIPGLLIPTLAYTFLGSFLAMISGWFTASAANA
jgi:hypothetical protein